MPIPILPVKEEPLEEKVNNETKMELKEVVIIESTPSWPASLDHWEIRQHPLVGVPNWTTDAQHEIHCECIECVQYFSQRAIELTQ